MISKKLLPASVECALCTKFGDFLCERCGETYCSKFCQMSDWREHRRFCMPVPRLLQRSDAHGNAAAYPNGRMIMDASASFDATDAIGSVSEHSAISDSPHLTREQVQKLSSTLSKMQIEAKNENADVKGDLSEIGGITTPKPIPSTPAKAEALAHAPKPINDDNASVKSEVKGVVTPKQRMVLTPPPKKQKNYNPSVKSIQERMHVTIVHVAQHDTLYVVPTADIETWQKLVKEVDEYSKTAESLKKTPEVGFIISTKPENSDSFSRGIIQKVRVEKQIAKVEFLEFGLSNTVKFSDMKCLPENLVNACRLVNQVKLSGVANELEHASEMKQFLEKLQETQKDLIVKNLELIEKTATSAHFTGILIDTENFSVINEQAKILKEEKQPTIEMEDVTEALEKSKMEIETIGFSGKNVELCILDNSFLHIGCFSAVKTSDMALLVKNDAFLNENAASIESGPPFHPRNGETCLAQAAEDKRWYRASTQNKIDDNTYNVLYIDYGNMEHVTADRIREMRQDFVFPCITAICFIDGLCDITLTPQAVQRLKQLIVPYSPMVFDDVQCGAEDTVCKSNKILETLKSENLI